MRKIENVVSLKVSRFSGDNVWRVIELEGEKFDYGSPQAIAKLPTLDHVQAHYIEQGYSPPSEAPSHAFQALNFAKYETPKKEALLSALGLPPIEQQQAQLNPPSAAQVEQAEQEIKQKFRF